MTEKLRSNYRPDYTVAPGAVLEEYIEALNMTQADLALRTGLARKTINEIIKGKSPVTPETAIRFERVLGRPAHIWINLEALYQQDIAREAEERRLSNEIDWLKSLPVRDMTRKGWIRHSKDKVEQLRIIFDFLGIADLDAFREYSAALGVAYRKSSRFPADASALAMWLRRGELLARDVKCAQYDSARFHSSLKDFRSLTRETDPAVFVSALQSSAAENGVAVVFIPELPRTRVSGATRWIGGKPVIQLSLRYKSNDHLWFTFFHEAAHILKHGRKIIFLEGVEQSNAEEAEADRFARDLLIPPADFRNFLRTWDGTSLIEVAAFADSIAIAPGFVVGRLQHEGLLAHNRGNELKVRYVWRG